MIKIRTQVVKKYKIKTCPINTTKVLYSNTSSFYAVEDQQHKNLHSKFMITLYSETCGDVHREIMVRYPFRIIDGEQKF